MEGRPIRADVIVPVPLAEARRRERGFNQAELIARPLGTLRGIPVDPTVLRRSRDTPPQVGLSAARRRENVRDAFAVADPARVADQFVLLVDDVATTGATLRACAEPLKAAGARRVVGLVVARDA